MAKIDVTHDGINFTDSEELATYLNISPNTLIALLKQNYTVSEIIEHNKVLWPLAERRRLGRQTASPSLPGNHCRTCQVAGTVYPSQIAAARAYHIPIQTIYSRMQRQSLTFEQAVLRGYREEHLLVPTPELYKTYHKQMEPTDRLFKGLADFQDLLVSAGLPCQALQLQDDSIQAIRTEFEIWDGNTVDIWLLYLRERELLETIIPRLCNGDGIDTNKLNRQTATVRFCTGDDGSITASFSERFRPAGEGGKYTLRSFYQFLGACAKIVKQPED